MDARLKGGVLATDLLDIALLVPLARLAAFVLNREDKVAGVVEVGHVHVVYAGPWPGPESAAVEQELEVWVGSHFVAREVDAVSCQGVYGIDSIAQNLVPRSGSNTWHGLDSKQARDHQM